MSRLVVEEFSVEVQFRYYGRNCRPVTLTIRPSEEVRPLTSRATGKQIEEKRKLPEGICEIDLDLFTSEDIGFAQSGTDGLLHRAFWAEAMDLCTQELERRHPVAKWKATSGWTKCDSSQRPYMGMTYQVTTVSELAPTT